MQNEFSHQADEAKKKKRKVDLVVISDVHLGTYGCHAKELNRYLKSIKPKTVVLNGDIIDMWQFSKHYFPKSHLQVVKKLLSWIGKGVKVYYLTGNHDEMLRRFAGLKMGSLVVDNKLLLELDGKKVWLFHGDVFDVTMQHSKWLTKLGAHGYDTLILLNALANWCSVKMGRGKISFSKKIKNSVKSAVKFVNNFETTCADVAVSSGYDYVVCGHIHHPEIKTVKSANGEVVYMNSGDWVENLTALEYHQGVWSLYRYSDEHKDHEETSQELHEETFVRMNNKQLFNLMLRDFNMNITATTLRSHKRA